MRKFTHHATADTALHYTGSIHGHRVRDWFQSIADACERFSRGEAVTSSNWTAHQMPPVTVQAASKGHSTAQEPRRASTGSTRLPPPEGAKFERLMHMRDGGIEYTGDAVYIAMMAAAQPVARVDMSALEVTEA